MNGWDILIVLLLAAAVTAAVFGVIRARRRGCSGCPWGDSCPDRGSCRREQDKKFGPNR